MRKLALILILLLHTTVVTAKCNGRFINPITDVCWSCLFPLTLGHATLASSSLPDPKNPSNPVCHCTVSNLPRIGLSVGFWEPIYLVEVTRTPFCFPTLGGFQLNVGLNKRQGTVSNDDSASYSEYHVHVIKFPLLSMLGLLTDGACSEAPDLAILLPSELDPTWQNEALALYQHPEAIAVSNHIMTETCSLDCLKANTGLPLNHLFWCQGCQGGIYPFTGRVAAHVGGVQASNLLAGRALAKWHRMGLMWQASGTDNLSLCQKKLAPWLPKSSYRMAMIYPKPSTNELGCLPLGRTTQIMEAGHEYPVKGEDFGWMVWRKRNCCAF